MNRIIAVLLLTLLSAGAHADLIFEHDGHTYKLIESTATWEQAKNVAEKMTLGGHSGYLARIDSAAENKAIFEIVSGRLSSKQRDATTPNDGSGTAFIWLGGSDAASEGDWRWLNNGDPFWLGDFNGSSVGGRYHNWGVQPDDATGSEDALAMGLGDWPEPFYDLGAAGQWNDLDPGNALMYVIEFDTVVEPMQMNLDEPLNRSTQAGVGMIRGWVVSEEPVERIEVHLNGEYAFDIPYGDPRPDVGAKFPDSETAATSGFSVPYRFSALPSGEHTVDVVVVDRFGNRAERSSSFEVVRFQKGYIGTADTPNMDWSYASALGKSITVRGVSIGGVSYDIELQWQTRSQKFEIVKIDRTTPE
ncbi:MAG: hypothetical protein ACPF86_04270 [Luminiphilus sp.]